MLATALTSCTYSPGFAATSAQQASTKSRIGKSWQSASPTFVGDATVSLLPPPSHSKQNFQHDWVVDRGHCGR